MKSQNVVCVNVYVQSHFSHVQLCDTMDCSPPDSSVHGILQTRILELVAVSFSKRSSQPRIQTHICLLHWQADSLLLSHQGSPCSSLHTFKISLPRKRPIQHLFQFVCVFWLHWAFSVAVSRGYSLVPMQGFLITGASLVWSISSRCLGSVVAAHRLQSTGSVLDHHGSPFSYFLNS